MKKILILTALLVSLMFSSCTTLSLKLRPGFQETAEAYTLTEEGSFFHPTYAFGPYTIDDLYRGWGDGTQINTLFIDVKRDVDRYSFTLQAPQGSSWEVDCEAMAASAGMDLGLFFNIEGLDLEMNGDITLSGNLVETDTGRLWQLRMSGPDENYEALSGTLVDSGGNAYRIEGSNYVSEFSGRMGNASGYHIYKEERQIASIDVIGRGPMYLRPLKQDEKNLLAALCSALYFFPGTSARND